jgi:glycosyltransferase involved in cell wall biosynthesis
MKILLLANHFNTGGISTYLLTLIKGYISRGHQVFLATSGGDRVTEAEALGAVHVRLPGLKVKCEFHPGLFSCAVALRDLVKAQSIDILHPQTRVTQSVAALVGFWSRRPYVSTCHGFFRLNLFRILFPLWGQKAVAISGPVVRHLTKDLWVPASKVVFVPNGIDSGKFFPVTAQQRQELRARFEVGGSPLVGIIARLSDVKGHAYLIQAMNELVHGMPGVKCLIIGEGPLEQELKEQVAHLQLEASVKFVKISGEPAKLLPMFDVVAAPSLQEGLGLSVMEAQACGVPVVASRVGGLVEAVKDGVTGVLVPPRDHLALADALMKVLSDKDLSDRFGSAGREWIIKNFSTDQMVGRTLAVYEDVLKACSSS